VSFLVWGDNLLDRQLAGKGPHQNLDVAGGLPIVWTLLRTIRQDEDLLRDTGSDKSEEQQKEHLDEIPTPHL
jgi:hypothetical protein